MKKENFLKQFPKEQEYLASKLYNYYEIAQDYEIISFTEEFYTPNFWKKLGKKFGGVNIICDGVFEDSDRRQIAFVPDGFVDGNNNFGFENNESDFENFGINRNELQFPNKLLKISIDSRFQEYLHKDFLGSLMGLNVRRELMGDLKMIKRNGFVDIFQFLKKFQIILFQS